MIKPYRQAFNKHFTKEKYQAFLDDIHATFEHKPSFRIAETPVFIPVKLKQQLMEACEDILAFVTRSDFKELTKDAIKHPTLQVPSEDYISRFYNLILVYVWMKMGSLHRV